MTGMPKLYSVVTALVVAMVFIGCSDSSDRGLAGSIDLSAGSASDTIGVGGHGGSVSMTAGDNIFIRAGDIPDPEISSTNYSIDGEVDAATLAANGLTNTSANGIRTLTFTQNVVIRGTLTLSGTSETLLVVNAPTIHVLGTIDLSGNDSTTVATRGKSVSLNATEQGGEIFINGQINTNGGSGDTAGQAGHIGLHADNCGTGLSSPGLTSEGNVIIRGRIFAIGGSGDEEGANGGSLTITACNDIFVELLPEVGVRTSGGNGTAEGGHGGGIELAASLVDTNGSIVTGETIMNTNGGSGGDAGDGGGVSFSLAAKTGNAGTGDIINLVQITADGGSGTGGFSGSSTNGGDGGDVSMTTWDSGQDIRNEGTINSNGGDARGATTGSGGDGGDITLLTDADNNDLGGMVRNEGRMNATGGDAVSLGGDGGDITFDTDGDDGEDASNGEGENLGDLTTNGGNGNASGTASSTGGNGGLIFLRARGAFQTSGSFNALGGSGTTNGASVIPIVD